jgi:hypothetical protein
VGWLRGTSNVGNGYSASVSGMGSRRVSLKSNQIQEEVVCQELGS